jgi:hypothetical protein
LVVSACNQGDKYLSPNQQALASECLNDECLNDECLNDECSPTGEKSPSGDSSTELRSVDAKEQKKCPHSEIISLYHKILPELPHIQVWDETSKRNLKARWRQDEKYQSLEFWQAYFGWIRKSDFLMGKKTDFAADLHWLVRPTNFAKTINGRYHNRRTFEDRLKDVGERWLRKMEERDNQENAS